jgi:hypothetical protein
MRMRMTLPPNILDIERFVGLSGEGARWKRGNLSVQPILLIGKRKPCLRHSRVAAEGWLPLIALRQLQAVFGVFPEYVRLLHRKDMGMEPDITTDNYPVAMEGTTMNMPLSPIWTDIALRLALTMLAGAVVGFDRGARGHGRERATPPRNLLAALDCRYEIKAFELTTDNGR